MARAPVEGNVLAPRALLASARSMSFGIDESAMSCFERRLGLSTTWHAAPEPPSCASGAGLVKRPSQPQLALDVLRGVCL